MVKEIQGNLLDFPEDVNIIAHQANCQATMGAGIARQIRERYPEVSQEDRDAFNNHRAKLGLFSAVKISDDPKVVVNLYGQDKIGGEKPTDYEGIYSAMDKLYRLASKKPDLYVIGFPHGMSCGLGGGDWRIIRTMIEVLAEKYEVQTRIVKFSE
jgi:O-acetyl-ADP-ribose deacetylase (regulator of RNase III)